MPSSRTPPVEVPAAIVSRRDRLLRGCPGVVGPGEIGRTAHQIGNHLRKLVQHLLAGLPGRPLGRGLRKLADQSGHCRLQCLRELAQQRTAQRCRRRPAGSVPGLPRRALLPPAPAGGPPVHGYVVGDLERIVRPIEGGAGAGDFLRAERSPVRARGSRLGRSAQSDGRPTADQRGARVLGHCPQCPVDRLDVVPVDRLGVPAKRGEPGRVVVRHREAGRSVDRDTVVVQQDGELTEPQMAGEAGRLMADPFHHAAVAGNHPGAVIDQVVAKARVQHPLGERHADRIGQSLAERARRGLDAHAVPVLRMAGRAAAELAEALELLEREVRITREMQQRVEQHRAVTGRQDEPVAVRPFRVLGIELEVPGEQHRRDIGHAHRHARVPGSGPLDRVHGEGTHRIGHAAVRGRRKRLGQAGFRGRGQVIRKGNRRTPAGCNMRAAPRVVNPTSTGPKRLAPAPHLTAVWRK